MELIRAVNIGVKKLGERSLTAETDIEILRLFLAETAFEKDEK